MLHAGLSPFLLAQRLLFLPFLSIFCLRGVAQCSTFETDFLSVSTIAARGQSGLSISSHVIFSNTRLLLSGASGTVTAASSITASAFFGNATALSSVLTLSDTQTFSGANSFQSTFSVRSAGREISISTGDATPNLKIASAGVISFFPELHNSSHTLLPETSTTATAFGPCINGSTITITTSGGNVEVVIVATLNSVVGPLGSTHTAEINFLQDGLYVDHLSNIKGLGTLSWATNADTGGRTLRVSYLVRSPVAGSHSYCVTINGTSGGPDTVTTTLSSSLAGNIFYVKETK